MVVSRWTVSQDGCHAPEATLKKKAWELSVLPSVVLDVLSGFDKPFCFFPLHIPVGCRGCRTVAAYSFLSLHECGGELEGLCAEDGNISASATMHTKPFLYSHLHSHCILITALVLY